MKVISCIRQILGPLILLLILLIPVYISFSNIDLALVAILLGKNITLTVEIPSNAYTGKGWAQVWVTWPGGMIYTSTPLDGASTSISFEINMTQVREQAISMGHILRKHGVGAYATVRVIYYSVDEQGRPCIATWTYTTLDYYKSRLKDPTEASDLAKSNPLDLLKAGKVRASPGSLAKCKTIEPPGWAKNGGSTGIYREPPPQLRLAQPQDVESSGSMRGNKPLCHPLFVEVFHRDLHDSASSPPATWMERLEAASQEVKVHVWKMLAQRLSYAYYFPSDCPVVGAKYSVTYWTGIPEGLHAMDQLVRLLAAETGGRGLVSGWRDAHERGHILANLDKAPLLRILVSYDGQKPSKDLRLIMHYLEAGASKEIGLAFMGQHIVGRTDYTYNLLADGIAIIYFSMFDSGFGIGYVFAPMTIVYLFDAFFVFYDVENVTIGNGAYIRVTPYMIYLPYYEIVYGLNKLATVEDDYLDPHNADLINRLDNVYLSLLTDTTNGMRSLVWITAYNGTLAKTGPGNQVTLDESINTIKIPKHLGILVHALLLNELLSNVSDSLVPEDLLDVSNLASDLFTLVTAASSNEGVISVKLEAVVPGNLSNINVLILKKTLKGDALSSEYRKNGITPLAISYRVILVPQSP